MSEDRQERARPHESALPPEGLSPPALLRQNAILQAVSHAAQCFLGGEPLDQVLPEVLERLGSAAQVGSATVLEFADDPAGGLVLLPRHTWVTQDAASIFSYAPEGFPVQRAGLMPAYAELKAGNPLIGQAESLPEGLRDRLPVEVRTLAAFPIFADGDLVGVIGMSQRWTEREWTEPEISALKTAATIVGAAIERSRSRRALQKGSELLRLFVDNAPVMVAYYDTGQRCMFANQRYAEFFGSTHREIVGRRLSDIIGEEAHAISQPYQRRAMQGETVQFERTHLDHDGATRHLEIKLVPHRDEAGEIIGSYATVTDITARRLKEDELRRVAAENAGILENTVAGIGFFVDRKIMRCNRSFARLFGYEESELLGRSARVLYVSQQEFLELGTRFYPEILVSGHTSGTQRHRKKDGSSFWAHYSATLVDKHDPAKGLIVVLHDVTEQKNAEADLRKAHDQLEEKVRERTEQISALNRDLEAYSYSISHDLRAPLRAIDGFSKLLEEHLHDKLDGEAGEYLAKVRSSAKRMFRMIEALLGLSSAARKNMAKRTVDLSLMAREIVDELAAQSTPCEVEVLIGSDIKAQGDPTLIRLLLQNLLENAWKYTSKTPQPRIEFAMADDSGGKRQFRIRDNGAGFDMQFADRLFQPFQRLHSAHEFEGTGIGLATAARIVRRHGGEISASSEAGKGATFVFTLAD